MLWRLPVADHLGDLLGDPRSRIGLGIVLLGDSFLIYICPGVLMGAKQKQCTASNPEQHLSPMATDEIKLVSEGLGRGGIIGDKVLNTKR